MKKRSQTNDSANPPGFDWDQFLAGIKSKSVPYYAILSKCEHEVAEDCLKIYTRYPFYKKKLNTNRFLDLVREELSASQPAFAETAVNIIDSKPRIEDEVMAKVAAVMGGGEVVENG